MKERNALIINTSSFLILSFLVAGFQTAFWPAFAHFFYGAELWVVFITYFFVYRNLTQGLIFAYINTLFVQPFTSMQIGFILALQILILIICNRLRKRIFWNTLSYFMIVSALSVLAFDVFYLFFSNVFEVVPLKKFTWGTTFSSLLLSPVFSFIFFHLGRFIDSIFEPPSLGVSET